MNIIIPLILFALAGIAVGVLYDILIIKKYPDNKRKGAYVVTVFIFLLFSLAMFFNNVFIPYTIVNIDNKSVELIQEITENNPNNAFVRNGIDLNRLSGDSATVDTAVNDIISMLPSHTDLGIGRGLYNIIVGYARGELSKRINVIDTVAGRANVFADENNILTVSSVVNGVKNSVTKIINIASLIILAVVVIIVLIYIIMSLLTVKKEKAKEKPKPIESTAVNNTENKVDNVQE